MRSNQLWNKLLKVANSLRNKLFGHREYRKFVIISRSRTGSTHLMSLLNNHPQVECGGEIFKNLNQKSCLQVWNRCFNKRWKTVKQVGFRLFYYHPFDDDKAVWDFLKSDSSITIIHLTRQNMLRTLVSQRIAVKTNTWKLRNDAAKNVTHQEKQIELSVEETEIFFQETKDYEFQTNKMFENHNLIKVSYEGLESEQSTTMNNIFSRLRLVEHQCYSSLRKQNLEHLSELVLNYGELKNSFSSSEYRDFFS